MNILYYPLFENYSDLNQHVLRATWYLYPLKEHINKITFLSNLESSYKPKAIDVLDQTTVDLYHRFDNLEVADSKDEELVVALKRSDYVFVHEESKRNELIQLKNSNKLEFQIVRVDYKNVQYADSFLLRFAEKIKGLHESFFETTKTNLTKLLLPLQREKAYLFGTGPNFEFTKSYDFSDGLVIACNSMVVNHDIIDQLKPDLFVIADPIFHAGPSSYAESFRASFLEVLGEQNCPVVVPMRDYHIYRTYFHKEIVNRLIPIPFENAGDGGTQPLLDIFSDMAVRTTSNILTLFQIPLACSLAKEIYISGCDGRPLSQNNYFWNHNKSVQINDKMADIQRAHPSFFDISYDDYYEKHLNTLREWLDAAEKQGKIVENLTPSYIPALNERSTPKLLDFIDSDNGECDFTIIIPLYNAEDYIEEAVVSIINDCSELNNVEILIIDDLSEDGSLDKVTELQERYNCVKLYQNFCQKGVSGARNTGLALANGSVIGFLDADDFVLSGSIPARYQACLANQSIVHSTLVFVDSAGESVGVEVGTKRNISYIDCAAGNPCSFNTLMFPNRLKKLFHFQEGLKNGEDWLTLGRVLRTGLDSIYVPDGKAVYRIHENSTVIKNFSAHEKALDLVIEELHSPSTSADVAERYRASCFKVTREEIKRNRRFNVLVMKLFNQVVEDFSDISSDDVLVKFVRSDKNLERRLRVPFVRSFNTNIDLIDGLTLDLKKRIALNLSCLRNEIGPTELEDAVKRFLRIPEGLELNNSKLNVANTFLKTQDYSNALSIYEELMESSPFYEFLSFNIGYCKAKLG